MSKPFLFIDFYRTLSFDHLWSAHPESAQIDQTLFGGGHDARVAAWMRGQYTAEEIVETLADVTGLPLSELWESLVDSAAHLAVLEDVAPLIVEAKQTHQVVLFTDNFDTFTRFTVPGNPDFYGLFDRIVNSADVGLLKCDEAGQSFLRIANESITKSVLIDDSDSSKETFEALGGRVFQVGTPELTKQALRSISEVH